MGCGTSQVKKTERSNSQVTIESQQRTVAAYRRQRIARDMEQIASLRAEAEVEKALMLKRSSLGSVDDRRPSYVMRVLEDLAEVEEGQEEVEERNTDPVILNGTYHTEKLAEQEKNKNERNIALHSSVTQQHSVTPEKEMEDELHFNEQAQYDELVEDHPNDKHIALPTSVTQENRVTPEEKLDNSILTTHAQNEDESKHALLHSSEAQSNLLTTNGSKKESNLETDTYTLKNEQNSNRVSDVETKDEDERERSGSERDSTSDSTTHAQENSVKTDHNLTNHDREEGETGKEDEIENKLKVADENSKDKLRDREPEIKQENELESKGLEGNGIQESTDLPDVSNQSSHS